MIKEVTIADQVIGPNQPVYLIAEIGGNFRDFTTAAKLVDLAKQARVDAVKLQHYRAETLTSRKAIFDMENTGVASQYDLFKQYELSEHLTAEVMAYCREKKIAVFSTPSHQTDVDLLEKHNVPVYKIGSDDAVNTPLLKYVARLGKPILLSTGMCTLTEVQRAVDAILEEGNDQLALLHCVTNYPAHPESVNLRAMQTMQTHFNFPVGYSDHTLGIDTCYAAAVLGATILEFHFTFDKKAEGPDHMLSKDYEETVALVAKVRQLPILLGDGVKRPAASEMSTRHNNRKSLVLLQDVKAGNKITPQNIGVKRPGYGIPCEYYYNVLGKTASRNLHAEDVLSWEDLT